MSSIVGEWLPEPVFEQEPVEDVTLPLLVALDRLSPLERAAFLLHDVFGQSFEEVAASIDRDPAACRQLAARARANVRAENPRFPVEKQHGMEIASAFFVASRQGDMGALQAMLAQDVASYSDGGGKRPAGLRPIHGITGRDEASGGPLPLLCARAVGTLSVTASSTVLPGFITREADGLLQTTALLIEDGQIRAIYVTRNPDKLEGLESGILH